VNPRRVLCRKESTGAGKEVIPRWLITVSSIKKEWASSPEKLFIKIMSSAHRI
jgi:hypothetical protein